MGEPGRGCISPLAASPVDPLPTSVLIHVLHHLPRTRLTESSSERYSMFLTTPCQVTRPRLSADSSAGMSPLLISLV